MNGLSYTIIFILVLLACGLTFAIANVIKLDVQIKKNKKIFNLVPTTNKLAKNKSKLELLKEYVESFIVDSGIDLENVYVHNENITTSSRGFCLFANSDHQLTGHCGMKHIHAKANEFFLMIPEVTNYETAYVCIHEVAHFVYKHAFETKASFMKEYEADLYAYKMLDKFYDNVLVHNYENYELDFLKRIHQCDMNIVQIHTSYNITHYINERNVNEVPQELIDFMYDDIYSSHLTKILS